MKMNFWKLTSVVVAAAAVLYSAFAASAWFMYQPKVPKSLSK